MVRQKMIFSRWTIKAWLLLLPFYLFTFISTLAPLQSAPMGGFTFVTLMVSVVIFPNVSIARCPIRPATCSNSFEGMAISLFTSS